MPWRLDTSYQAQRPKDRLSHEAMLGEQPPSEARSASQMPLGPQALGVNQGTGAVGPVVKVGKLTAVRKPSRTLQTSLPPYAHTVARGDKLKQKITSGHRSDGKRT